MKKIIVSFLFILPFLACQKKVHQSSPMLQFIPPEAAVVINTNDLNEFFETVSTNSLLGESDFPLRESIEKELKSLQKLQATNQGFLCFSTIGREVVFTFITENDTDLLPKNASKNAKSFQYDGQEIKKINLENALLYSVVLDGIFIGSDSKLIVENLVRLYNLGIERNTHFEKAYAQASGSTSLFINGANIKNFYQHFFPKGNSNFLNNLSEWAVLDINLKTDAISLNGILQKKTSNVNLLQLFTGLQPQKVALAEVCPMNAIGLFSFVYDDFSVLKENFRQYRKKTIPKKFDKLFSSAREIGIIYFPHGEAVVLNSTNIEKTKAALLPLQTKSESFRGSSIYSFSEKELFSTLFTPLIKNNALQFYTSIGHFFIFSEDKKTLENIIANHQNGSVVALQTYYKDLLGNLTDESSVFFLGINGNLKKKLSKESSETLQKELENFQLNDYKISAIQLVYDEKFIHVNMSSQKTGSTESNKKPTQIYALETENPLVGNPQFFEYWRSGEKYILASDTQNQLYLFNDNGKLVWKKQLDGPILGSIKTVDLYKNTRLQMAFVTQNSFYVVGIDGEDVKPFPLRFDDAVTQELAVFDYATNRNYRFVIVQDKKVSMFDNSGKRIGGFEFGKANSSITQSPTHIRIGTKDYIVIPEISGKLNILNREGKPRVIVKKNLKFSTNEWYLYEGKFTSTNALGDLLQVDENGNISTKELKLSDGQKIAIGFGAFVTLSDNILTINQKKSTLPYGNYTTPQLFHLGQKTVISTTDLQEHQIYLFDLKGELLPGFPIYGSSAIDLTQTKKAEKIRFTVKGEDNRILVYSLFNL